jgi:hypothetical protein
MHKTLIKDFDVYLKVGEQERNRKNFKNNSGYRLTTTGSTMISTNAAGEIVAWAYKYLNPKKKCSMANCFGKKLFLPLGSSYHGNIYIYIYISQHH